MKVQRYSGDGWPSDTGVHVTYEDYATLKAENERLRYNAKYHGIDACEDAVNDKENKHPHSIHCQPSKVARMLSVAQAERDRAVSELSEVYRNAVIMKADMEEAEGARDRWQGEVKRLRGVMRGIFEPGSEAECNLCWVKKEILRQGVYPGDEAKTFGGSCNTEEEK